MSIFRQSFVCATRYAQKISAVSPLHHLSDSTHHAVLTISCVPACLPACSDMVFTVFFTIEAVLKIIAFGFKPYMSFFQNQVDIAIVVSSLVMLFLESLGSLHVIKVCQEQGVVLYVKFR